MDWFVSGCCDLVERFYTSDFHIGHLKVANIRGFETVEAHDWTLAEMWRSQVKDRDHVWILGDLSLNWEKGLTWLKELPGTKHLITGNHDRCFPGLRDGYRFQRRYMDVFDSVQLAARHKIAGTNVLLSHFPLSTDRGPEVRYPQWRLRDEGDLLLHGHTHSPEKLTSAREVHVGWDAWNRLVTCEDVAGLFKLQGAPGGA